MKVIYLYKFTAYEHYYRSFMFTKPLDLRGLCAIYMYITIVKFFLIIKVNLHVVHL